MANAVRLKLDSGAYSAWRQGKQIDVRDYIAFIRDWRPLIDTVVTLDVIPGTPHLRTPAEVEASAAASYKNQQIMKDAGLTPIPVFHEGEHVKWLERYLKDGEPYIGISPLSGVGGANIRKWLDECFTVITDSRGRPIVKTHGFGTTQPALVLRYPWHTVDSTTWAVSGGYGLVYVPPDKGDGTPDYSRRPSLIVMTGQMQGGSAQARQFDVLPDMMQRYIEKYLAGFNVSLPEARYEPASRWRAMIGYYLGLQSHKRAEGSAFRHHAPSFLNGRAHATSEHTSIDFRVIFATFHDNYIMANCFRERCADSRLLSYWHLRDNTKGFEDYITKGIVPRERPPKQRRTGPAYATQRRLSMWRSLEAYNERIAKGDD